jgi:hypothetical protein
MLNMITLVCLASSAAPPAGTELTADAIMTEVALHQDCALAARRKFLYHQKLHMLMHRGNSKLAREERREYNVTPTEAGFEKELIKFEGKYASKGKIVPYDKPGYTYKGIDIDGEVLDSMANDLTSNKDSRDGIAKDEFPLTTDQLPRYVFHIKDTETYRGRKMYRIAFDPKTKTSLLDDDTDGASWKGEALIDAEEYQPAMVETNMAQKIPAFVKTFLGTNIQGFGFTVSYQKFAPGVWFPVSYGTEFRVKAVFFYTREISVSLVNDGFRRTDVSTKIEFADQTN